MTDFREIRRRDRALTEEQAREILAGAERGVLATLGADGWPYAIPVNHALSGSVLYIHCAVEGHKLENIAHEERVSFCIVPASRGCFTPPASPLKIGTRPVRLGMMHRARRGALY